MTKAEIIRKLAKKVGVSDLDAKIFFEVFLRKVSQQLNPGETIKINNFGYFQMRTGKINNTAARITEPLLADLIVFYPLTNELDESAENLIFNVPAKKEEEYNVIDSYFSLSFGKPVIPLKDANKSEYFIPPTGNELKRLFDSKADKLLQDVEVIENFAKGDDVLLIDSELVDPNQIELNWNEINENSVSLDKIIIAKEPDSLHEFESYSWEFGQELEKQIEEDALLDTENGNNLSADYNGLKDISWDFGENLSDLEEYPKHSLPKDEVSNEPDEFQRVKSSVSDFNIDHHSPELVDHVSPEDSDLLKSINEELNEEGFAEIKHPARKYQFDPNIFEKLDQEMTIPEIENSEADLDNKKTISSEPVIEENIYPELRDENHPKWVSQTIPPRTEKTPAYSKTKGLGLYVIFAVIVVLGITAFVYLRFISPFYSGNKKVAAAKVSVNNTPPVIIERDYEVTVTYPYPKDSNKVVPFDPIDKSVYEQTETKKNNEAAGADLKEKTKTVAPVKQPAQPVIGNAVKSSEVKANGFISKSGDKYIVQISAWSTQSRALKHAADLKGKGFQTEIIKANLANGIWYRVRVLNFKTENEAQNFYNKYK